MKVAPCRTDEVKTFIFQHFQSLFLLSVAFAFSWGVAVGFILKMLMVTICQDGAESPLGLQ
jgi:nitrate reductase NapE component